MKSKICTTIDQCKKLLDLGIDINTADLTVTNYPLQDGSRFDFICCKLPNDIFPSITDGKSEKIPAWSLTALLELIPPYLGKFNDGTDFGFSKSMNGKWYSAHYIQLDNSGLATFTKTVTGNTSVDTVFEMICWLKENGHI